ncbi:MAG: hypothetical protein N3F09_00970 [Bacteroidia bacterium]|nr:hypothetical protein [Bacteroidia bacterium]
MLKAYKIQPPEERFAERFVIAEVKLMPQPVKSVKFCNFIFLKNYVRYIFLISFFLHHVQAQYYYGSQMEFGKNRVQRQPFNWTYFDFEKYRVYSYAGGGGIAKYISIAADREIRNLSQRLDFHPDDKINILVFNNQEDLKQSNIGLSLGEAGGNIGGTSRSLGDKVFVFFNGNLAELEVQLRYNLAELYIKNILNEGSLREMLRSSLAENLPEWYVKGLAAFLAKGWNSEMDNYLYDMLKFDAFNQLNRLKGPQAERAGHAFWFYLADIYGESVIPNILYMTKITHSIDNAILIVLGTGFPSLLSELVETHQRRIYLSRDSARTARIQDNSIIKKYRPEKKYFHACISPDGKKAAWVENELSRYKVYVSEEPFKNKKKILKFGYLLEQVPDHNYPLLSFHPNSPILFMIYEKKDQLVIHTYDLEEKKHNMRFLPGFEKINSFSFSPDGKKMALSGVKKGKPQSDIFVFTLNNSGLENITNDCWDDSDPVFFGTNRIVFSSNRMEDTLRKTDDENYLAKQPLEHDLYMASYPGKITTLIRITSTPHVDEKKPRIFKNQILYLSNENGIYNLYKATFDSTIAYVDTTEHYRYYFNPQPIENTDRNLFNYSVSSDKTGMMLGTTHFNGKDYILIKKIDTAALARKPYNTWYKNMPKPASFNPHQYSNTTKSLKPKVEEGIPAEENNSSQNNKGLNFNNYIFSDDTATRKKLFGNTLPVSSDSIKKPPVSDQIKIPIQQNYYVTFYRDFISTQLDRSYLGANYQRFSFGYPIYLNPDFNILNKLGFSDLMEDHQIIGAFRFSNIGELFTYGGWNNEVLISYENRKKLLDHKITVHRQHLSGVDLEGGFYPFRTAIHSVSYMLKYPFNPVLSIRGTTFVRHDRTNYFSINNTTAKERFFAENYAGGRLELVFDNSREIQLNILRGMRWKIWTEYWNPLHKNGSYLLTSGADFRVYTPIHRNFIWANRIALGNSLGTDRLIFYLGGVDNWLNPGFNSGISIYKPEQYQFQTLATNLRGFDQNIRNGNNFALWNTELRFPIFSYLSKRPIKSEFVKHFQIIGFFDMGAAWWGWQPLSNENTDNINIYMQGSNLSPIYVIINNQKDPLVAGYGWGVRSKLFGYFVRLDFTRGIENLKVQKRMIYLSLTTDF